MKSLNAIILAGAGILLYAATAPAMANGKATIDAGDDRVGTMELAWRGEGNVRLTPKDQPGYMLLRDGKVYSVSNAGGQTLVMDISSMSGMMSNPNVSFSQSPTVANAQGITEMKATGGKETVAGIQGEVYQITWTDHEGKQRTDEAVLSDDERAVEMTAAFRAFAEAMAKAGGQDNLDAVGEKLDAEGKGVLRFSNQFKVTALSGEAPPAEAFELPAEPTSLQKMMEGFGEAFKGK